MNHLSTLIKAFTLIVIISACSVPSENELSKEVHDSATEAWVQDRIAALKKEDGWLNLVGLHWITGRTSSMGSDPSNEVLVPEKFPGKIGTFTWEDSTLRFNPEFPGITHGEELIENPINLFSAASEESPKTLTLGSLQWTIIKRGDAIGIRIRDLESPAISEFKGIPRFPTSLEWRLTGEFTAYTPAKEILITNVIGQTSVNLSPGFVSFEKDGKQYQLDALDAGNQLYLILADGSSGIDTYGGGRYLYIDKPKPNQSAVVIDFNQAYNPPCVFTPYATCPLPPRQNILELTIAAGEKYSEK